MAYTAAQLISFYSAANVGVVPDGATTSLLTSYAAQTQSGQMSDTTALSLVVNTADSTTAVANTAYQFFTAKTPGQAGLAFLVNSPTNPTDLNDPYYTGFNIENRYMNFAANLGLFGDGAATFKATYASMTFTQFVTALYETIIGSSYVTAAGFNPAAAIADIISRQNAFIQTGRERGLITASTSAADIDLATKAVVVGYLLVEGMKADLGIYAAGSNNLTQALINGTAQYNVNLLTVYSPLGGGLGQAVPGAVAASALTTAGDNIVGATANDTYNGTVVTDTPAASTFSTLDSVNGGGGNDTLNVVVSKAGGGVTGAVAFPGAALTSVETVNIRSLSTTVGDVTSVNAATFSGTTAVNSDRSTNVVTVTNLAVGASGGVIGDASTVNGAFNFGYAATGGGAVLNVSGGTRGASQITITSAPTSVTINSAGSVANTVGFVVSSAATSATVNATAAFSTSGLFLFTGATASITVQGSAAATAATTTTAALPAVNLGALEGTVNSVNASGLTAAGVWAGIGANTGLNFTGSGFADMVNVNAGTGTALTGTINGSGGTDTVQFNTAADLTVGSGAKFTSFETVAVTNSGGAATLQSYTPSFVTGAATTQVLASTGSVQILGLPSGGSVTASGNLAGTNAAGALSLMLTTAAGGSDSLTLNLNNTANPAGTIPNSGVAVSSLGLGGTTAGQVETLNIVSGGAITTAYNSVTLQASGAGPNFADPNAIVVTGSQGLTLTTGVLGHNLNVNAAGASGGLNFNSAAGGAFAVTVTGTAVNDTITLGGAGQTALVLGGIGADAIIITAGMGAVTSTYTAANQSILDLTGTPGTSGTSTPSVGTMDFIGGFRTGTDKIGLTGVGLTGVGIADKGSAGSAAAVTALMGTAGFFSNGISNQKAAQFDYAGGTILAADINGNGNYDAGADLVVFLAGVANVAVGDIS